MIDPRETYEVYALRYASRQAEKAREFFAFDHYGEPNQIGRMDYYFWLARNGNRTVLIDCGYNLDRARRKKRYADNEPSHDPLTLLELMKVKPTDIDHVVLSHMHLDHVGNVGEFPNATFSMARSEFDFWTGKDGARELLAAAVDADEKELIVDLKRKGRLHLVEESEELFPGIRATKLGGHTPGLLMTEITGRTNHIVVASDGIHYYEEFEKDRPFWLFVDLLATYRSLELFREFAAQPNTAVIPGHDPAVMRNFTTVHENFVVDLNRPVEGTSRSNVLPELSSARPAPPVD